jgi:hypothetical protein
MLEHNALGLLGAATEVARLRQILTGIEESTEKHQLLTFKTAGNLRPRVDALHREAQGVGAKLACVSTERLLARLNEQNCQVTLLEFSDGLKDIESRLADHLKFLKFFVIPEEQAILFEGADRLLKHRTAALFPSIWFDCEESAKCLCLSRYTASVFHTMRILEIAIASFAKRLGIADPVKATDRSWGVMLNKVRDGIDTKFPKSKRLPDTEGSQLEAIYVSLDAIKNPWRNATMHVESVYTEEEARHILVCTSHLMDKMASVFDENGQDGPLQDSEPS